MKYYYLEKKLGFTLVEMLLAVAVLAVLSGAILVSISSQREKARVTKKLSELSAVVQPIYMCVADKSSIKSPDGGSGNGDICDLSPNYGQWPSSSGGFNAYSSSDSASFSSDSWYFYLNGNGARICCNSHLTGCEKLSSGSPCDATTP